jgi:transcriptional regulator with XRE-family HTH domain
MTQVSRKTLKNRTADLRHSAGWSQSALAQRAGLDKGTVCRFEGGDPTTARVGTAWAIACALGVGLGELFGVE